MRSSERRGAQIPADTGGYFGVDKMVGASSLEGYPAMEEDFLVSTNAYDIESDEEASSGDDDELMNMDDLLKEDSPALDDEKKYMDLLEPLFTPNGAEFANPGAGPMTGSGGDNGKLPFNRRKIRYFDSISAADTMAARRYLRTETGRSKQKEVAMLGKRLRRIQRQEKKRLKLERGESFDKTDLSSPIGEDSKGLIAAVSKFEHPMTPATSAALLIESLSLNLLESIEGMSKCYEGIVAAGVALLEAFVNDPISPSSHNRESMVSRTEIVASLTPLLITSLEQASGEVILSLAKIRRMCGTPRYQRRFVQRVAPSLIRPPKGAMWCLRHQNDMEPILAAAELIFDSALEIFSKGWYDRGQLLLADTKRAETLNTAAMQLRNLSTASDDHLTLGGSLTNHGAWRTSKYKDGSKASNEQLAEWEVIAVDRQIRVSISSIVSMDWSKILINHKDSDAARAYHRSRPSTKRSHTLLTSGEASPKGIAASPLSPNRLTIAKSPMSPHGPPQFPTSFQPESSDFSFPTSFPPTDYGTDRIPPPPPPTPPKPPGSPKANRSGVEEIDTSGPNDFSIPSNFFPPTIPRSPTPPRSPKRDHIAEMPTPTEAASPIESRRNKGSPAVTPVKGSISNQATGSPLSSHAAPLSPSSPSTMSNDSTYVPHRPITSVSSIGSVGSGTGGQPAHYRMLTSTAAERKRTVAACRALRAQITRFEDAFIQLHGRPPKGAAERAPLATTYAQYREWKRAIRADAACRIQALFRGARTRWTLSRSNDPQMSRIVKARAGRANSFDYAFKHHIGQDNDLVRLQIPAEIGEGDQSSQIPGVSDPFRDMASKAGQTLPPQWGGSQSIRRPRTTNDGFSSPVPKPIPSSSSPNDLNILSFSELQARKRDLKQQLKQYDMNFARRHGRMPVKAEKEPIRHLYEKYNALKSQMNNMEQEGRRQSGAVSPVASSQMLPQRTLSPVSGMEIAADLSPVGTRGKVTPVNKIVPPGPSNQSTGSLSQDLAALKAEKGRLHQMLRSYEKDFYKEHKRQVSSFTDIRPVASQYRRYKEIKKAIAAFQQGGEK
jgi:hypothetical protein